MRFAHIAFVLIVVCLNGCSSFLDSKKKESSKNVSSWIERWKSAVKKDKSKVDEEAKGPVPTTQQLGVQIQGRHLVLGNSEFSSIAPVQLVERVRAYLSENRFRSARALIAVHVDAASEAVETFWCDSAYFPAPSVGHDAEIDSLRFIALSLDAQTLPTEYRVHGMTSLVDLARNRPEEARKFYDARDRVVQALHGADDDSSAIEELKSQAQRWEHPLPQGESLKMASLAELIADHTGPAFDYMATACQYFDQSNAWSVRSETWLSLCDIARRNQCEDLAIGCWRRAIEVEMIRLKSEQSSINPNFWIRADSMMPSSEEWPIECCEVARHCRQLFIPSVRASTAPASLCIRIAIAEAYLERGEPQRCILECKKAETICDAADQPWLRFVQAKCLAAIGSGQSSISLLTRYTRDENPIVASAAKVNLGSIRLQLGAFEQGRLLLQSGCFQETFRDYDPYLYSHALADLANAEFVLGNEAIAIEYLHQAQSLMEYDWIPFTFVQSLQNEIAILKSSDSIPKAEAVRKRLVEFEQSGRFN